MSDIFACINSRVIGWCWCSLTCHSDLFCINMHYNLLYL